LRERKSRKTTIYAKEAGNMTREQVKKLRRRREREVYRQWFVLGFATAGVLCSVLFWLVCRKVGMV